MPIKLLVAPWAEPQGRPCMAPPYVTSDIIKPMGAVCRLPWDGFVKGCSCGCFFSDHQIVGSEIPFPGTQFFTMEFYPPKFSAALRAHNENTSMDCLKIVLLVNRICS